MEIYIDLSQESSRWTKIQNLDIVRLGLYVSFQGFLEHSRCNALIFENNRIL
jgi:hypothetical protein